MCFLIQATGSRDTKHDPSAYQNQPWLQPQWLLASDQVLQGMLRMHEISLCVQSADHPSKKRRLTTSDTPSLGSPPLRRPTCILQWLNHSQRYLLRCISWGRTWGSIRLKYGRPRSEPGLHSSGESTPAEPKPAQQTGLTGASSCVMNKPQSLGTVLEQFRLKRSVLIVRVIVHSLAGGLQWKHRKDFLLKFFDSYSSQCRGERVQFYR